ncbi:MAG TPA: LPS-assembly protein LptD [Nitrosomonas sp.]|nr:LPS-assembly protein LptD [Nitrosomonas sp.]
MNIPLFQFIVFILLLSLSVFSVDHAVAQQINLKKEMKELPIHVEADRIEGFAERHMEAIGKAQILQGDQFIAADRIKYYRGTQEVEVKGKVRFERDRDILEGSNLKLFLDTKTGELSLPQYILKDGGGRGAGQLFLFEGDDQYRLKKGNYTTCPIGNDDWYIRAEDLEIDNKKQVGTARDVTVRFKDVPILYLPWMNFSYSGQRKTGLLAPVFGNTIRSGVEVSIPFYWNIAPNIDATFTSRNMSRRGAMLNTEFRYMGQSHGGQLNFDILPNDLETGKTRYGLAFEHMQHLGGGWTGNVNYNQISDREYFRDLATSVAFTSRANLVQQAGLSYVGSLGHDGVINFNAMVQGFQTIQDPRAPIISPYKRLPQMTLNMSKRNVFGTDLDFTGVYTHFYRPDSQQVPESQSGHRMVMFPSISVPLQTSYGYIKPKMGVHFTRYELGDSLKDVNVTDTNPQRVLPIFSLDSGVVLERDTKLGRTNFVQTLEPRLYYLYIPFRNQNRLPNFDSAEMDFSFAQIFTENRFSGHDRINDANEVTFAMTSRLIEQSTGNERVRIAAGQRVRFTERDVVLSNSQITSVKSDFIAAISGRITPVITTDSSIQLDQSELRTEKIRTGISYHPAPGKVLNVGYRFTRGIPGIERGNNLFPVPGAGFEQVDFSTQWPVLKNWQAMASANYSLDDDKLLAGLVGLEYNACCWSLRFVMNRFVRATGKESTTFFVQLELNGLMRIGTNPLAALRQGVPGYTRTSHQ